MLVATFPISDSTLIEKYLQLHHSRSHQRLRVCPFAFAAVHALLLIHMYGLGCVLLFRFCHAPLLQRVSVLAASA